jgi:hypothetical protein
VIGIPFFVRTLQVYYLRGERPLCACQRESSVKASGFKEKNGQTKALIFNFDNWKIEVINDDQNEKKTVSIRNTSLSGRMCYKHY